MKRVYGSNAERQKAYRDRKYESGFTSVNVLVPDQIVQKLNGEPRRLVEAYFEVQSLRERVRQLEVELERYKEGACNDEGVILREGVEDIVLTQEAVVSDVKDVGVERQDDGKIKKVREEWYKEYEERRAEIGLSLTDFAREKGVNKSTLSRFFKRIRETF